MDVSTFMVLVFGFTVLGFTSYWVPLIALLERSQEAERMRNSDKKRFHSVYIKTLNQLKETFKKRFKL